MIKSAIFKPTLSKIETNIAIETCKKYNIEPDIDLGAFIKHEKAEEMMQKAPELFNFKVILSVHTPSEKLLYDIYHFINVFEWSRLLSQKQYSQEMLTVIFQSIQFFSLFVRREIISTAFQYQKIDEAFIRKTQPFIKDMTLAFVYLYPNILSDQFIEEFSNSINWHEISSKYTLSFDTIKRFLGKIDLKILLENTIQASSLSAAELNELEDIWLVKNAF